ncbi:MAG TPA: amidohydrolase family protein [Candidatus Merdenecus merdavium]|nr:amidohydrolase family protein [Candidatus Merdenecus merdavium]
MGWIKNVRLETGRQVTSKGDKVTITKPFSILVENGLIQEITEQLPENVSEVVDARNYLALPSLKDQHIHLDKGHYGGAWHAVVPMNGVADRIKEEEGFLIDFLKDTPKKAQALIDLITGKGATFLRVQVNVDPVSELKYLYLIQEVLEKNRHKLDYELVVFPQHGTLATEKLGLLSKALEVDGVGVLGGLDPASIDQDIEKSLTTTFRLAKKYNKEIDIHLHDGGSLGIFQINRIIDYTLAEKMEGKVQISHAFSLADIEGTQLDTVLHGLKTAGIAINTTVPIDIKALPIPDLLKHGVKVHVINDNINDHWSPFGTGDLVERASRAAEVFSMTDEVSLSKALGLITKGVTPLDESDRQVWPKVGDPADFLFTKSESSAHLIGRVCEERVVFFKGKQVSGKFY